MFSRCLGGSRDGGLIQGPCEYREVEMSVGVVESVIEVVGPVDGTGQRPSSAGRFCL